MIHEVNWIFMLEKKRKYIKKSVINKGTNVYNELPRFLKEIDDLRVFRKILKLFLLFHSFYTVEEFVSA